MYKSVKNFISQEIFNSKNKFKRNILYFYTKWSLLPLLENYNKNEINLVDFDLVYIKYLIWYLYYFSY